MPMDESPLDSRPVTWWGMCPPRQLTMTTFAFRTQLWPKEKRRLVLKAARLCKAFFCYGSQYASKIYSRPMPLCTSIVLLLMQHRLMPNKLGIHLPLHQTAIDQRFLLFIWVLRRNGKVVGRFIWHLKTFSFRSAGLIMDHSLEQRRVIFHCCVIYHF